MSNTMTASHEPTMHYLDSILNEEEKRCDQYSHQWRNFTISRSGRFRSKNKKRDVVDGKLFDGTANHSHSNTHSNSHSHNHNHNGKENDKISARNASSISKAASSGSTSSSASPGAGTSMGGGSSGVAGGVAATSMRSQRDKTESYKSFYETNL